MDHAKNEPIIGTFVDVEEAAREVGVICDNFRKKEIGPVVTLQDILECTPFDDMLWMLKVTWAQFRCMVKHILRDEVWVAHTEFYQFSKSVRILL